jgi:hypothetical protein
VFCDTKECEPNCRKLFEGGNKGFDNFYDEEFDDGNQGDIRYENGGFRGTVGLSKISRVTFLAASKEVETDYNYNSEMQAKNPNLGAYD